MTVSGWCLVGLGALLLFFGFAFDVSIHSDSSYSSLGFVPASDVINIGKLQQQMMIFQAGLAACLAGVVLIAAGMLGETRPHAKEPPLDVEFNPADHVEDTIESNRIGD